MGSGQRTLARGAALAVALGLAVAITPSAHATPKVVQRARAWRQSTRPLGEVVHVDRRGDATLSAAEAAERARTFAVNDPERWRANRDLFSPKHSYEQILGTRFIARLHALTTERGEGAHWLDVGAGELAAIEEYLRDPRFVGPRGRLRTTGLAATPSSTWASRQGALARFRARGLFGRYLHELSRRQVGTADLISDVFGAAAYTDRLDEVVAQYAYLLRPGGEAHVVLSPDNVMGLIDPGTTAADRAQRAEAFLREWLGTARGFRAELVPVSEGEWKERGWLRLVLTRTVGPIEIGALRVESLSIGSPPIRRLARRDGTVRVAP